MMKNNRLLTTREVSEITGLNQQTVRRYCRLGVLPARNISIGEGKGKRYRIEFGALKRALKKLALPLSA